MDKKCIFIVAGGLEAKKVGGASISVMNWMSGINNAQLVCAQDANKPENSISFAKLGHISFNPLFMNFSFRAIFINWLSAYRLMNYCLSTTKGLEKFRIQGSLIVNQGHWCTNADFNIIRFCMLSYLDKLKKYPFKRKRIANFFDLKTRVILNIEKKIFSAHSKFLALSEHAKADVMKYYPQVKDRIYVVENGVDKEKFRFNLHSRDEIRNKYGIPTNAVCIIFPGGNIDRKGYKTTIKVLNEISRDNVYALIVVKGAEKKKFLKEGVKKRQVFIPWSSEDIQKYLSASDILLFPTIYDVGPKVILEALVSGVYVITNQDCGIPDLIPAGAGIAIDKSEDVEKYSGEINNFIDHIHSKRKREDREKSVVNCKAWQEVMGSIDNLLSMQQAD